VLRISISTNTSPQTFVLEGRLIGPWATELLRIVHQLASDEAPLINLDAVTYVDQRGEVVLRLLSVRGAIFQTETAYGRELCRLLHLRHPSPVRAESYSPPTTLSA